MIPLETMIPNIPYIIFFFSEVVMIIWILPAICLLKIKISEISL